jgi:three-Cys-motif partner protein
MADSHHQWQLGGEPPIIRAHSLAKHRVLENYLLRYIDVLTGNLRIPEFRFTLVDGFAGGGLYRDWQTNEPHFGSPLLMLRAMRDSALLAQRRRKKEFRMDVEYIFVEKSPPAFQFLQATIQQSEFCGLVPEKVKLVNDEFINQVDMIVNHIRSRRRGNRAIFLLDQCGFAEVPFFAIRSILTNLSNAEVILTFAAETLIDYLGSDGSMQPVLAKLGLEIGRDQVALLKQQHDNWKFAIQALLHRQLVEKSGAKYFTPFFIRSKDAHRDLWLIHLSNHSRARDVMTELHWAENKSFAHYGGPGLMMLGYDQDFDEKVAGHPFLFDDNALQRTNERLLDQLPERLSQHKNGITFASLFSMLTNETPATSDIIKTNLAILLSEGQIEVRDETGLVKRHSGVQRGTDVLKWTPQRVLFLGS